MMDFSEAFGGGLNDIEKYFDDNDKQESNKLLNDLNENQKIAVTSFEKPLLILAGAGSGKTRVITYKIAHILANGLAFSYQILAVTFTNKAAREMCERVNHLGYNASEMNIGTFHSICVKMLRRNADQVGFSTNFVILDSADQKKVIKDILSEFGLDVKVFPPQMILFYISKMKERFLSPDEVGVYLMELPSFAREIKLDKIYKTYQDRLRSMNAMDFDDLLFFATKLLINNKNILEQYQKKFRFILIDEYQDINVLQFKWFQLLAGDNKNVCCVGDDDQSIYGWRGADVSIILSFKKHFKDAEIIKLEQNYRSTGNILSVADSLISKNSNRHGKQLWTEADSGEKVLITCYPDGKAEARDIVSKIAAFKKVMNRNYSDNAILVRASSQTRILEEAFISSKLPYKIIGGLKFYERKEVKDILSYIKLLNGSPDDIAFERVLSVPKKGIGDSAIDKIYSYSRQGRISLFDGAKELSLDNPFASAGILTSRTAVPLTEFLRKVKKWQDEVSDGEDVSKVLTRIVEEIKYIDYLKEEDADAIDSRIGNINELIAFMQTFSQINDFLEHVSLVSDQDDVADEDNVKIMTMHTSKGLEFPIVFLPGWEEDTFPSKRTVDESGEKGIEEERRLAYVAITRARENLFISFARARFTFGQVHGSCESRFVSEIKHDAKDNIDIRDKSTADDIRPKRQSHYDSFRERFDPKLSDKINDDFAQKIEIKKEFKIGQEVKHKMFGKGKIVARPTSSVYEVEFYSGETKSIRFDFLI